MTDRASVSEPSAATTCGPTISSSSAPMMGAKSACSPQIVAAQVQQVEGEIRQPIRPPRSHSVVQAVDMRDAALVRHRDLAIQHHGPAGIDELAEGRAEAPGVIEPLPAQQLERAVTGNDG